MKNFKSLVAMLVALIVMTVPVGALAVSTDAEVIQIANPVITMDGQSAIDLNGLALQLAEIDDERAASLILDLIAGGKNVSSAMLQVDADGEYFVGKLGGMSDAYALNSYELGELLGEMILEAIYADEDLMMLFQAISSITATPWSLPQDLMAVLAAHEADIAVSESYTNVNAYGTTLTYTDISGDLTAAIADVLRVIENDSLIGGLLAMLDPEASLVGMADAFQQSGMGVAFEISVGTDDFGAAADLDAKLFINQNGSSIATFVADISYDASTDLVFSMNVYGVDEFGTEQIRFTVGASATDAAMMVNASLHTNGGPSMNLMANGMLNETMLTLNVNVDAIDSYGDSSSFTLSANAAPTDSGVTFNACVNTLDTYGSEHVDMNGSMEMTDTGVDFKAVATISDSYDDATIEFAMNQDFDTGSFSCRVDVKDAYSDVYFDCAISEAEVLPEGMDSSTHVALNLFDGYTTLGLAFDVNTLTAAVDTDSFYINPVAAINLLTMDEAQLATALAEIETVMGTIFETITSVYPDLNLDMYMGM